MAMTESELEAILSCDRNDCPVCAISLTTVEELMEGDE